MGTANESNDKPEHLQHRSPQELTDTSHQQQPGKTMPSIAHADALARGQPCMVEKTAGNALAALAKLREKAQQLSSTASCIESETLHVVFTPGPQSCLRPDPMCHPERNLRGTTSCRQHIQFAIPEPPILAPIPAVGDTLRPLQSSHVAWHVSEATPESSRCERRPLDPYRTPGAQKRQLSFFKSTLLL